MRLVGGKESVRKRVARPKKTYRLCPSEDQEQAAFVKWLEFQGIPFYHIPNGGGRSVIEGAKFKRLGVKPGVPDICIPVAKQGNHALYIELKRKVGGVVSDVQYEWIDRLTRLGCTVAIAQGCDEAIEVVKKYFGI